MIDDEDFIQRLIDTYDPDDIVDLLGVSTEEILDRFSDVVQEKRESLLNLVDNNEGEDND